MHLNLIVEYIDLFSDYQIKKKNYFKFINITDLQKDFVSFIFIGIILFIFFSSFMCKISRNCIVYPPVLFYFFIFFWQRGRIDVYCCQNGSKISTTTKNQWNKRIKFMRSHRTVQKKLNVHIINFCLLSIGSIKSLAIQPL